eukprot:3262256-Amphidinium_carterae.1
MAGDVVSSNWTSKPDWRNIHGSATVEATRIELMEGMMAKLLRAQTRDVLAVQELLVKFKRQYTRIYCEPTLS